MKKYLLIITLFSSLQLRSLAYARSIRSITPAQANLIIWQELEHKYAKLITMPHISPQIKTETTYLRWLDAKNIIKTISFNMRLFAPDDYIYARYIAPYLKFALINGATSDPDILTPLLVDLISRNGDYDEIIDLLIAFGAKVDDETVKKTNHSFNFSQNTATH